MKITIEDKIKQDIKALMINKKFIIESEALCQRASKAQIELGEHIKACETAGMRNIGWHTFRHTFASRLAENGISMRKIQELLGHSDTNTTMRYAHLSPVILHQAIKTLSRPVKIDFGHNMPTITEKVEIREAVKCINNSLISL